MKGIILAGGAGTRLHPMTCATSKQLLPVYDKPMIYYPISTLMLGGIRDILVITTPEDQAAFKRLLGDGSHYGIHLSYAVQPKPEGLAQAFIIGKDFIGQNRVTMALGDNIFYGPQLGEFIKTASQSPKGATIFAYYVSDPERFGIVEFDAQNRVISIEEKPKVPRSNYAVTGLYVLDQDAVEMAQSIRPSARGELEITGILNLYRARGDLQVHRFKRGYAWLDTGTPESLLDAANFIRTIQKRQGLQIACLQEIALENNWMTPEAVRQSISDCPNTAYAKHLKQILGDRE